MKILLISGHGAGDPGATGTHNGKTYRESDLTRTMTAELASALLKYCDVDIYPVDRNAFHDALSARAVVNYESYDYVLEVHFNAFKASVADGATKGTELYVTNSKRNGALEQSLVRAVASCGLTNRGVKVHAFRVIAEIERAGTPAALMEICFIDDADDMKVFDSRHRDIAEAIAATMAEAFSMSERPVQKTDRQITQDRFGFDSNTMAFLDKHPWKDALYKKLATAE